MDVKTLSQTCYRKDSQFSGRLAITDIVLLLLGNHAEVELPNDVRYSNTKYTVDMDTCACYSHC